MCEGLDRCVRAGSPLATEESDEGSGTGPGEGREVAECTRRPTTSAWKGFATRDSSLGPRTWVYPGAVLRGWRPGDSVVKVEQKLEAVLVEAVLLVVMSRR